MAVVYLEGGGALGEKALDRDQQERKVSEVTKERG